MRRTMTIDGGGDEMDEDSDSDSDADERHFHKEVSETFFRALRDNTIDENVTVELQGLKMAENRTFADIARYVCAPYLRYPCHQLPSAISSFVNSSQVISHPTRTNASQE